MRVVHLSVRNFRGIRSLDWSPAPGTTCLVGIGDSTKTTILEALELSLFPRAWIQFVDSDFFAGETKNTIEIVATIVDIPSSLTTQDKFGLHQRGWTSAAVIRDEAEDDDEDALSIRLKVDEVLEPTWHVINNRLLDGIHISARDREALAVARVGDDVDRQLSWVRGSSLARVTSDATSVSSALSEAHRIAREAVSKANFPKLSETAKKAGEWGASYGAHVEPPLSVGVDPRQLNVASGALSLRQSSGIPARAIGLGSRRLLALAIQQQAIGTGVVTLVDEIEHGLEPHRLRHLLSELRSSNEQVVITTHSATAIEEIGADGLAVVRRDASGHVEILHPDASLQPVIRSLPSAFLASRVVVCEGATEFGMSRGLVQYWDTKRDRPLASLGTVFVDGEGVSHAAQRAAALRKLDFPCVFWGDSDAEPKPSIEDLEALGIKVVRWSGGVNTEQRIMEDIPPKTIQCLWDIAAQEKTEEAISDKLYSVMCLTGTSPKNWSQWTSAHSVESLRSPLGQAAAEGKWFKNVLVGEEVGRAIAPILNEIAESDLGTKLAELEEIVYAD